MYALKKILKFPFIILIAIHQLIRHVSIKLKLMYLRRFRHDFINIFSENIGQINFSKVLVVITHVVSEDESKCSIVGKAKVERLSKTISGIQSSFAHCSTKIFINTIVNRDIVNFLPQHQRNIIEVRQQNVDDPMFVEFKAQDLFMEFIDEYDYFLFLEDDIVIHDSCILDKIDIFNKYTPNKTAILFPHRYEMFNGVKFYIDMGEINGEKAKFSKLSSFKMGEVEFAECTNPHSAFYCLSKEQMKIWELSGRNWYNTVSAYGKLESAATFCLFEAFTLYKPHPRNINFLEVEHYDDKYSKMYNPEGKHFSQIAV